MIVIVLNFLDKVIRRSPFGCKANDNDKLINLLCR